MYLLDTNIFLEYILRRSRVQEVKDFFTRADLRLLAISDFSIHTIGVIYSRERKYSGYLSFVNEDIIGSGIRVLSLRPEHFSLVMQAAGRYNLDFDDAYQHAIAEYYNLSIVSFDHDFDRTDKGRSEPKDLFLS